MAVWFPRPDTSAIDVAQETVRVTGVVSSQPVRNVATLSGTITPPMVVSVMPNAAGGAGVEVVSGRARGAGETVGVSDVVAEVSDRPVFAFLAGMPLFPSPPHRVGKT